MVSADIRLLWRVGLTDADALHATYRTVDPVALLRQAGGRAVASFLAGRTLEAVLGENREAMALRLRTAIQQDLDAAETGIELAAVVIEAIHPPGGAADAYHAVQAAQIDAEASIAAERGRAHASLAEAQQLATGALTAAQAGSVETTGAATAEATRFAADRDGDRLGGGVFRFERYLANLTAALSKAQVVILDHRIEAPDAPVIDLRPPLAATGLSVRSPGGMIARAMIPPGLTNVRSLLRFALAGVVLAGAVLAGAAVMVSAGEAVVVTEFGAPVRVLTEPGLAWKLPAPLQSTIPVDLRLRTSSTGLQDVGTRDGLRILVQAYVAWQVPPDPDRIRQFLRSVRNDPDEAARQLRSLVGSALQVTASSFDFAELVNTDPARLRLADFEQRLKTPDRRPDAAHLRHPVQQVGLEMLSLPDTSLVATVARMRSERETVAAARTAEGLRAAGEVRSNAERDARITVAHARTEAAEIEAAARREAAEIQGRAYLADPQLYLELRGLDSLVQVVGNNTRLILRTDAAPFSALVQAPKP